MEKERQRPRVLVSACLLGECCKYNGGSNLCADAARIAEIAELIPVCPERIGGLPTPRRPAERKNGGVFADDGTDVTAQFMAGAQEALRIARRYDVCCALFKERSPSCGAGEIYDGSFTHTRVAGDGIAAQLLKENNIRVFGESQIEEIIRLLGEDGKK